MTWAVSLSLSAFLSSGAGRTVGRDDEESVVSGIVRWRLTGFVGLRRVDASDFPIWRGECEDLTGS